MRRLRSSTQPISMMRSPSFGLSPVVSVSRTICLTWYPPVGQAVCPLVFRVPCVALHPVPFYVVLGGKLVETPPQVLVFHRLLVGGTPAAALPVEDPDGNALHDVQRIGIELHSALPLQRLERADYGHELHPVIGGGRLAPEEFFFSSVRAQKRAPASRTGIAA